MTGISANVKQLLSSNINDYNIINGNGNDSSIQYKIPLLADFIEVLKDSDKDLVIEIKDSGGISAKGAAKLLEMIRRAGVADRTYIISFYRKNLRKIIAANESVSEWQEEDELQDNEHDGELPGQTTVNDDKVKTGYLISQVSEDDLNSKINWAKENGIDLLSVNHNMLSSELVAALKENGMACWTWTVDDPNVAADLLRYGVDAVTTNTEVWE